VSFEIVNPASLGAPRGFNHGILAAPGGRLLFIAGQVGIDTSGEARGFVDQFACALDRVIAVIREAGGEPRDIARLTLYVTDLASYRGSLGSLGDVWRARMGNHYPAMALVEVKGLVDRGAEIEIEGTAVIGGKS